MKKMKKLASILLAAIMVLAMAVPSMAADASVQDETVPETSNVTVSELASHTFKAYQIFSGVANEAGMLGNIEWAEGFDKDGFIAALKAESILESKDYTAIEVSEVLAKCTVEDSKKVAQYAVTYKSTTSATTLSVEAEGNVLKIKEELPDGYYVIVDESDPDDLENSAFNRALLQVSGRGDIEIQVKTDKPTSQKKVMDVNDSTNTKTGWQDSADYDIGDDVPFQLTGTLPNNVSEYETYNLVFHDKQSTGLSFDAESVVVNVNGKPVEKGVGYSVVTDSLEDGCTFEIQIPNVKAIGAGNNDVITVEYTAKLNKEAEIGAKGNPNVMHMEYSNNPDVAGKGETGTTTEDKVIVFTFKTEIDKIDEKEQPLVGAQFTLKKWNATTEKWEDKEIKDYVEGVTITFTFEGLDDGYYCLEETKTPAGYNTIDPIYFEVTAGHDVENSNPQLTSLDANQKKADADGKIDTSAELDNGEITFKPATPEESGSIEADVVNKSGATLPETGGIGTTIFYVLGSILVLGAVILLVTKRRMNVEK